MATRHQGGGTRLGEGQWRHCIPGFNSAIISPSGMITLLAAVAEHFPYSQIAHLDADGRLAGRRRKSCPCWHLHAPCLACCRANQCAFCCWLDCPLRAAQHCCPDGTIRAKSICSIPAGAEEEHRAAACMGAHEIVSRASGGMPPAESAAPAVTPLPQHCGTERAARCVVDALAGDNGLQLWGPRRCPATLYVHLV